MNNGKLKNENFRNNLNRASARRQMVNENRMFLQSADFKTFAARDNFIYYSPPKT